MASAVCSGVVKFHLGWGLFDAVQGAIAHLAMEPYFRRLWPRQLYVGRSWVSVLGIVLIALWGFRVTTAGRPLFRDHLIGS